MRINITLNLKKKKRKKRSYCAQKINFCSFLCNYSRSLTKFGDKNFILIKLIRNILKNYVNYICLGSYGQNAGFHSYNKEKSDQTYGNNVIFGNLVVVKERNTLNFEKEKWSV